MRPDDPALGPIRITVGCANFEAVPRDKRATLEKMDAVIAEAAGRGCDLVIFPELALNTWGSCPDCADAHRPCAWHRAQAERADGPACRAVGDMAAAHGLHVIYGIRGNRWRQHLQCRERRRSRRACRDLSEVVPRHTARDRPVYVR